MEHHTTLAERPYHARKAVSSTLLRDIETRGVEVAAYKYLFEKVHPSPAMVDGSIVHALSFPLLNERPYEIEPERIATQLALADAGDEYDSVAIGPEARRNAKAWTEFAASHPTSTLLIKPSELESHRIRAARLAKIARHVRFALACEFDIAENAWSAVSEGVAHEHSFFWVDEETGLECKARIDCATAFEAMDLKCTKDAHPLGFAGPRGILWTRRYFMQAAWYRHAMSLAGLADPAMPFKFVAVQPFPPYSVGVYLVPEDAMQIGMDLNRRALRAFRSHHRSDSENAYWTFKQQTATTPNWVRQLSYGVSK